MSERYRPPVPVKTRTARKQHTCNDCGKAIEPGDKYELAVTPPHREEHWDSSRWLTWRSHHPRNGGTSTHMLGCAMAAAYLEHAARELASAYRDERGDADA